MLPIKFVALGPIILHVPIIMLIMNSVDIMAERILQQGNLSHFAGMVALSEDVVPLERRYWQQCQRRYTFQPIYRTTGRVMAIELLTAVFLPSLPQQPLSPETYFASIDAHARLQIVMEQMQLLSHWHQCFVQQGLLASINIDGMTLLALQNSNEAKRLIASMPWLRFEVVENLGGLSKEVLTALPEVRHLWLDDFGCGMANFSSLMLAQYDCIKVARELFVLLQQSEEGRQLFPSLLSLLARFCNHIVIEGIETEEEWTTVRQSCAYAAQGYYLARPQSFDLFDDLKFSL